MKRINLFLCGITSLFLMGCGNDRYKKYVIEHSSEIKSQVIETWDDIPDRTIYKLDSCDYNYYTDVTFERKGENSYFIIFWGDRESWLWDFKLDEHFTIDVEYQKHKGKNIELDVQLMDLLTKLETNE